MSTPRRALIVVALPVVLVGLALMLAHGPREKAIDFHTYEAAALVGVQHGWSQVYDQGLVAIAQHNLVPNQRAQPFLSPPTLAWVTAPLLLLPYNAAAIAWAVITLGAFVFAVAWSSHYRGVERVVAAGALVLPWWVMNAVGVGQVVPLVAAGVLVAWRLEREERHVLAGLTLAVILLKPNTALFVPFALLAAGRLRTFAAWVAVSAGVVALAVATLGASGVSAYAASLAHLPPGANYLTLNGTYGLAGPAVMVVRIAVVATALVTAYRVRTSPGLAIALGGLASLITAPYLHSSDLCLFVAAAWIVWNELPTIAWRTALTVVWVAASPFVFVLVGAQLERWAIVELALFGGVVAFTWTRKLPATTDSFTGPAEFGRHAPA